MSGAALQSYNSRSPAVKRILSEVRQLQMDPPSEFVACPMEDDIFEWHFTIRGPPGTDFEGGVYHGRILLAPEYPMKPPNIIMLTPNGRFKVNEKICLSVTGYHPEFWRPAWGIRTVCLALISFLPTEGEGAIGSLDVPPEERRRDARRSVSWSCPRCVNNDQMILPPIGSAPSSLASHAAELEGFTFSFAPEKPPAADSNAASSSAASASSSDPGTSSTPVASASDAASDTPANPTSSSPSPDPSSVPSTANTAPPAGSPTDSPRVASPKTSNTPAPTSPPPAMRASAARARPQAQQLEKSSWAEVAVMASLVLLIAYAMSYLH